MDKTTVYGRFREIADRYPDSPAIVEDAGTVSFSRLDEMTDTVMSAFYDRAPGFVGIVMSHGAWQVAAMLAVMKSGGAYIPAEPSLPKDRTGYMMKSAGAELVITDDFCRRLRPTDRRMADRSVPEGAAYVLYTSGTSGRPKGVVVENHSVVNYSEAFGAEFDVGPGDTMLQCSVCSFDIFVEEVFASLLNGVAVCVPTSSVRHGSITGLMDFAGRHNVTIIDGFPYLIAEINKLRTLPSSVRLIISGGDVVRANYISNLRGKGIRIYNTYGPSETTVCSNYFRIDNASPLPDGTFPIGKPIKGVDVKILDKNLKELPQGETGEICIFGEGVSRGYLPPETSGRHDPATLPEQRNFVTLADGTRFYRSGDMGYKLSDGNFVFLRRRDDQVMILGRRVEPEEVENVLNACPEVDCGIVRSFIDGEGLHYLVAYLVPKGECRLHDLRRRLASKLADFMVPEFFVRMKQIPLTRRGKVDMEALPIVMKEGEAL